jgi:uncharacterized damage-inducible protein DinB
LPWLAAAVSFLAVTIHPNRGGTQMKVRYFPLLALFAAAPAVAQQHQQHAMHSGDHMAVGIQPLYETVKGYLIRSAEQVPEDVYSFAPTAEVRNFGAIVGHVANANYMFCATASGTENPSKTNLENTTGKAALVQALKDSFTFCDAAFKTSDAKLMEKTDLFGQQRDRFYALVMNISHEFEHYGNLVTYMRIKGIVPPSSQR